MMRCVSCSNHFPRTNLALLVTDGAGYSGCHAARALKRHGEDVILYDYLSRGYRVLAGDVELIEAEIADTEKLTAVLGRVDSVMHFAAYAYVGESVTNPGKYFQNNITDGLAFLDSLIKSWVRNFNFSSTCAVYGVPNQPLSSEDHPRIPVNPSGFFKLVFEQGSGATETHTDCGT